jgi:hypothetical protein
MLDLKIIGNVHTVLEGDVSKKNLFEVSLENFAYALGSGVFTEKEGLLVGEAIVYENEAYIYTPDEQLRTRTSFHTPFLMGVERAPNEQIVVDKETTFAKLYEELLSIYPQGYCLSGNVRCSKLEVAYLKLSPLYHENTNINKEKYWEQENFKESTLSVFGVVLPSLLHSAFYQNPTEKGSSKIFSHTHALFEMQARHLLTQSEIIYAEFSVEEIRWEKKS